MDRQIDRTAADRAIFDERLFRLRSVDLKRKNFAAIRTGDIGFDEKFHWRDMLRHVPNCKDATERVPPSKGFDWLWLFDLLEMKLFHSPGVSLRNRDEITIDPDLFALFREMA